MPSVLRFPRPKSFLHLIPLRTAAQLVTLTLLFNKATGLYGILALFTGYDLNLLQLSHYVYSLVILGVGAWLAPSIATPDAILHNLSLSWLYVLDTLANATYTALFGAGWFLVLAQHLNEPVPVRGGGLGAPTMNDTAGFTDPEHHVTHVDVIVEPASGLMDGQTAVAYGSRYGTIGSALFQSGSVMSLIVLAILGLFRIYFCIIMLSHARTVVRGYVAATSTDSYGAGDATLADSPFRLGREEGEGWKGRLGRMMLRFPTRRYWLGRDDGEEEWVRDTSGRFESGRGTGLRIKVPEHGVGERERRARSGTGPPPPVAVQGKAAEL